MGICKDNMPDLGNNGHCFAPKWYKMSQNYQPQQTCGVSMLVQFFSAQTKNFGQKKSFFLFVLYFRRCADFSFNAKCPKKT